MNKSSVVALIAGILLIIVVQLIETGSIGMLFQPVAFLIVVGGTFCAAIVNFGFSVLFESFKAAKQIFTKQKDNSDIIIDDIIQIAYYARKNGIFALEELVEQIDDAFLRRGVKLCIDINNPQFIQDILKNEITYEEEKEFISSRVFEALGGYAPTFGIVAYKVNCATIYGSVFRKITVCYIAGVTITVTVN